jgi:RNA recognition motif-containing protein
MPGDLFVGNLPFDTTEVQIRDHFKPIGEVHSVQLMTDRKGRSRCFGFILIENPEEAVAELNEKEFRGRKLRVTRAIPNTPFRPQHSRFRRGERY